MSLAEVKKHLGSRHDQSSHGKGGSKPSVSGGGDNPEFTAMQNSIKKLGLGKASKHGDYRTSKSLDEIKQTLSANGYSQIGESKTAPLVEGGTLKTTKTNFGFGDFKKRGASITTFESGKSFVRFGSFR